MSHCQAYKRESHTNRKFANAIKKGVDYLRKQIARIRRTENWIKKKMYKVGMEQRALLRTRLERILSQLRELLQEVREKEALA